MDLHGKCIILTGATGGIGSALCAGLVEAGATVVAVGRIEETLRRQAAAHAPGRVVPVVADLASESGRAVLLARAHEMRPAPSVLVLAHAQSHFGLLQDQDPVALTALVHLNLTVPMLLVQALLPAFVRQPHAAMVAVGSTFGSIDLPVLPATAPANSVCVVCSKRWHASMPVPACVSSICRRVPRPRRSTLRRWMRSMRRWEQRWIVPRTSPQRSCNRSCAAMHGVSWGGRKNCLPGSTGCCPNWWTAPCANSFTSSTAMRGLAALPPQEFSHEPQLP